MDYRVLTATACVSLLFGCTTIKMQLREAGEQLMTFPEPVAAEYRCSKRQLPFVKVERSEVMPARLRPGGRINHRFVYVMCPSRASEVVKGTLYTRIQYKGKTVHNDSIERELQPGRWVVDAFITLPKMATPGMYALEARFESSKGRFNFTSDFLVEEGRNLLGPLAGN
jgi:hypothetical protein